SIASRTVVASTSVDRSVPGINDTSERGRRTTTATGSVDLDRLNAPDRRQVLGDDLPAGALVDGSVELARACPEKDPGRVRPIDRQRLAEDAHVGVLLRQTIAMALPRVAAIPSPPHRERSAGCESAFLGMGERDDPGRRRVARMGPDDEPELGRQSGADVLPAPAGVAGSVDAAMVLLIQ